MGTLYRMALHTGMRQGELLALRWRDVDLDQGRIDVNATLVRTGGQWLRSSTKSRAGTRQVTMAPSLRSALARHRVLQAERLLAMGIRIDDDSLLFTDGAAQTLPVRVRFQAAGQHEDEENREQDLRCRHHPRDR